MKMEAVVYFWSLQSFYYDWGLNANLCYLENQHCFWFGYILEDYIRIMHSS